LNVKGGNAVWNSYTTVLANAKRDADEYLATAIVRADIFGWGAGDNKAFGGGDMIHEKDYPTDADFIACMKDANVVQKITRHGNDFVSFSTFTGKNGSTYTRKQHLQVKHLMKC